ncbi:MAG: glycosyltransferase [Acidobacteriota bacterium]
MTAPKPQKLASLVCAIDDHPLDGAAWYRALSDQTLPAEAYEVIISDSSHTTTHGEEFERCRQQPGFRGNIRYHLTERGGRALALNRAIDIASADLIIFIGDDCQIEPDFVETHVRFHETHPAIEAVGVGLALFPPELRTPFSDWLEKSGQLFGVPFDPGMTTIAANFFYVANASVKRKLLDRAGRFDERFAGHAWDDFELGERLSAAGMHSELLADATVWHMHRIDLRERQGAMLIAGAAAKVYAEIHPGDHPWLVTAKSKFTRPSLRAGRDFFRMRLGRDRAAAERWWVNRLDAAFAAGYQAATSSENKKAGK